MRLRNPATGAPIGLPMEHPGDSAIGSVLLLPDQCAVSVAEGVLQWDTATGSRIGPATDTGILKGALVLPNRHLLSWDGHWLQQWDLDTGRPVGARAELAFLYGARLLADGTVLYWGGHTVRSWNPETGADVGAAMERPGASSAVTDAQMLPDGRILTRAGTAAHLCDGHTAIAPAMQLFNLDLRDALPLEEGRRILLWGGRTLRLWDASWPKGTPFEVACALLPNRDLGRIADLYGVSVTEPICDRPAGIPSPGGSGSAERAAGR